MIMLYVKKEDLLDVILESKENDELTPDAVMYIMRMAKETSRVLKYRNEEDREDCISEAIYDVLKYWRNFNPNIPNSNVFAYFTQIIKNGLTKGWRKLHPIKMNNNISIENEDYKLFNI